MGVIMRLKEKEKEAKRDEILRAARKLFAKNGFENTSIEKVAKAAKVGKGTVYLYFDSKYTLFFEVVSFAKKNMLHRMEDILKESLSCLEKIKKMILIHLNFIENYPEYNKIFIMLHLSDSDHLKDSLIAFLKKDNQPQGLLQAIFQILEEGQANNEIRSDLEIKEEVYRLWLLSQGLSISQNIFRSDIFKKNFPWVQKISGKKLVEDTLDLILESYKIKIK